MNPGQEVNTKLREMAVNVEIQGKEMGLMEDDNRNIIILITWAIRFLLLHSARALNGFLFSEIAHTHNSHGKEGSLKDPYPHCVAFVIIDDMIARTEMKGSSGAGSFHGAPFLHPCDPGKVSSRVQMVLQYPTGR
jgi:hypothetical protein